MPLPALLLNPLVIKVIVGVVLALGVTVWWNVHNYRIRQAAIAEYKVKLNVCNDATATAVGANKSLQASMQSLMDKLQAQNATVKALEVKEAAARKARDEALAAALAKERALRVEVARLTVIANTPAAPVMPEQCAATLKETDDILRSALQEIAK
jgi:hypothetical protein